MPTLLHIDSSPLGEASISRRLSEEFVARWQHTNSDGAIIRRDLCASPLPMITAEWIRTAFVPEASRTSHQRELLSLSDALIDELLAADEYVIGVPMHNFTVASALRLWIDLIVRVGKTFAYVDGVPTGLLKNKKASFVVSTGGVYAPGTPMASCNFVEPYLRTIFAFIGVTDTRFHSAGGAAAVTSGKMERAVFLEPHLEAIRSGAV
jgi:FMN-dependent NADH-azoreductase